MHVILNKWRFNYFTSYFKYLGSQVAVDGGCEGHVIHRLNKGWGALKSLLSNRGQGIKTVTKSVSRYMMLLG